MTAERVRRLPYLEWENDLAWMETQRGKRWEHLLRTERAHYRDLVDTPAIQKLHDTMSRELTAAQHWMRVPGFVAGQDQDIEITLTSEAQFEWRNREANGKATPNKAHDLDTTLDAIWWVTDTTDPYVQELRCEDHRGRRLWKTRDVAEVAVVPPYAYYLRTDSMRSAGLYACDYLTGRNEQLVYEETNEERALSLLKAAHRTLYLVSEDPLGRQLYRIHGLHAHPVYSRTQDQIPLTADDALLRKRTWFTHGPALADWTLPVPDQGDIVWASYPSRHLLTLKEGAETLWYIPPHKPPKVLHRLRAGSFFPSPWDAYEGREDQRWLVRSPDRPPYLLTAHRDQITLPPLPRPTALTQALAVHRHHTPSPDGTLVPYVTVHLPDHPPRALLVYVYGAYGLDTPIQWPPAQWWPLLRRGWAIVYALVRGGGDVDDAWADSARREHRHRTIEDTEAVIHAAQKRYHVPATQTVLYGRSAGGVAVGAIVARWPKGERIGTAFTEVPYVDLLRTTTNPTLPLTVGEYHEFGNPIRRMIDFRALLHLSPVNALPAEGAPGVRVLTRVGLEDRQVFPYESFKWIQRLRGVREPPVGKGTRKRRHANANAKDKYITFEKKEEHVYRASVFPHFRALDLAVLHTWLQRPASSASPASPTPPCVKNLMDQ